MTSRTSDRSNAIPTPSDTGLANDQGPLAKDPFGAGWICKLKVPAGTKLDALMDGAAYQKHLDAGGGGH